MGSWKGIFHHVNIEKSWSVQGMKQAGYQVSQHLRLLMILTDLPQKPTPHLHERQKAKSPTM